MPSENLNEQEIQFKKRARRRLVGAVALVLLMVTILPMILDDKAAKAPQQDIAITIPSQDSTEFNSKIVPVAPEHSATEAAITDPEAAPTETSITPANPPTAVTPAPVRPDTPIPAKQTAIKPEQATEKPETPAPTAKSEASKTATEKPAVAKKEAVKPIASNDDKKKTASGFVVQIGVFSDPDNVKQMQQKLTSIGIKSGTEKISTPKGDKIRLRTGNFPTRAEADSALAKVQSAGLSGMVVTNK